MEQSQQHDDRISTYTRGRSKGKYYLVGPCFDTFFIII